MPKVLTTASGLSFKLDLELVKFLVFLISREEFPSLDDFLVTWDGGSWIKDVWLARHGRRQRFGLVDYAYVGTRSWRRDHGDRICHRVFISLRESVTGDYSNDPFYVRLRPEKLDTEDIEGLHMKGSILFSDPGGLGSFLFRLVGYDVAEADQTRLRLRDPLPDGLVQEYYWAQMMGEIQWQKG